MFRMIRKSALLLAGLFVMVCIFSLSLQAKTVEYALHIEEKPVNLTGRTVAKITVNGAIPGPVLRFKEGDTALIHVTNHMNKDTSIHWHGLLLAGQMDGVPGFNGFDGIKPGQTFTYRFKIRQIGTYWYHAHSKGQEQDGLYGAIIIKPRKYKFIATSRDYVVLLSDFHEEQSDRILANLKKSSEYYQKSRETISDFITNARANGFSKAFERAHMWGQMRMLRTDLSDVTGYLFLINGHTNKQNWTGLFKKGETVRLRFINASAMSFFDVRIPGLKMQVISSDGQPVEPLWIDEFRFGVAETYDVIVHPKENKAYTIVAESIDRTGFALGTLAPKRGLVGPVPRARKRSLLTMADMGMAHHGGHNMSHEKMGHTMMDDQAKAHAGHKGHKMASLPTGVNDFDTGQPGSGWANINAPIGTKVLAYKDLRFLKSQKDLRVPTRTIKVTLGGNMERYIWTLNGKKFSETTRPIELDYGERVRLLFVNETMMAHPMHLHGMFVQLENGQPMEKLPNKHTVIIAPGDSYSVIVTADEPGEWAFHCHLLYHMASGMMQKVTVARYDKKKHLKMVLEQQRIRAKHQSSHRIYKTHKKKKHRRIKTYKADEHRGSHSSHKMKHNKDEMRGSHHGH